MSDRTSFRQSPWSEWPLDREIVITRVVDAPRNLVFEAWTDPAQLQAWFGPEGFAIETREIDIRAGEVDLCDLGGRNVALLTVLPDQEAWSRDVNDLGADPLAGAHDQGRRRAGGLRQNGQAEPRQTHQCEKRSFHHLTLYIW